MTTILAAAGDIQIHLRARCDTEAEADALLAEVGGPIELLLGDRIYSRNGDPLEASWSASCCARMHATLSVAESCTGGMLGERITAVPGSSDYFVGGFITYTNAMKMDLLGVSPEMLREHGAVSKETAEAMAMGARRRTGSTYALSVTGVAGPDPVTKRPRRAPCTSDSPMPPERPSCTASSSATASASASSPPRWRWTCCGGGYADFCSRRGLVRRPPGNKAVHRHVANRCSHHQ